MALSRDVEVRKKDLSFDYENKRPVAWWTRRGGELGKRDDIIDHEKNGEIYLYIVDKNKQIELTGINTKDQLDKLNKKLKL